MTTLNSNLKLVKIRPCWPWLRSGAQQRLC